MRFIQSGVGGFGGVWVEVLSKEKRAKVVALVDINPEALEKARVILGCAKDQCYASLSEALKQQPADVLVCVTPPALHRRQVIAGLRAGLHVISEKPMASDLSECREMLKVAKATGKTYAVSQNYRYSPAMQTMARCVRQGLVGDIGQVRVDFWKGVDFHGGFRHAMDYPVLVDMSIHHFDLMRFITGQNAVAVHGSSWNPAWSNYRGECSSTVVFTLNNGARTVYNASWCSKGDWCDWNGNWHIEGSRGTLTYARGVITLHESGARYEIKRSKEIEVRPMKRTGQAFVLDDFIRSVCGRKRPLTDCTDNIHSIAMVFAAVEAVRTGRRVSISGLPAK